jgi:hypothetical protein
MLWRFFGQAPKPLYAIETYKVLAMHPSTSDQLPRTRVDSAHLLFEDKKELKSVPIVAACQCQRDTHPLEALIPGSRLTPQNAQDCPLDTTQG